MRTPSIEKIAFVLILAASGCATTAAPVELVSARAALDRAQAGLAAKFNPSDLDTAHKAMAVAEQSFEENGASQETRDLAYIADRRAQIAEARALAKQSTAKEAQTVDAMHADTAAQLGRANQKLTVQDQQLTTERAERAAADKRAAQAAEDLAKVASVKQEPRGMVITLSGEVLFASGKADLLGPAQVKLNSVADALTQQDPNSSIVVEGHTDSQGRVAYNQELSQRRAQNVRDYLVSRGIATDRVTSQGFGSTQSVSANTSAEGRANNRRVEIVITPKANQAP